MLVHRPWHSLWTGADDIASDGDLKETIYDDTEEIFPIQVSKALVEQLRRLCGEVSIISSMQTRGHEALSERVQSTICKGRGDEDCRIREADDRIESPRTGGAGTKVGGAR